MTTLKFHFRSTYYNGWPQLRFVIDNDVYLEHDIIKAEEFVELDFDLFPGDHELEIERYGKTDAHLNFQNGQILDDQTIELIDIYFDDIKLPDYVKYSGVFCYNKQETPSALFWGPNGIFRIGFKTPFLEWIIDQQRSKQKVIDLFDYSNKARLSELLNQYENMLDEK